MLGAYSEYQQELFSRIRQLRETKGLTFKAIADALIAEGCTYLQGFFHGRPQPVELLDLFHRLQKPGLPQVPGVLAAQGQQVLRASPLPSKLSTE